MIAPRGEETGRDFIVEVPNDLSNKGKLLFCDQVPYWWNVEKTHTNGVVCNVFVYDLRDWYAKYSVNTAVEENFQLF